MSLDNVLGEEIIRNTAKGRYNREKVREMFHTVYEAGYDQGYKEGQQFGFELALLQVLQALHYTAGFGATRLNRIFEECCKTVEAFDARAYTLEDIKKALAEDAKFGFDIRWKE